jgi:hypothetical protein
VGRVAAGTPAVPEFYDLDKYWPAESLERRAALRARKNVTRPA